MNKVLLMGRLTRDPEINELNGKNRAFYSLAVNGYGDHVDFINCVAFGKTGEFASKYLRKGMLIVVEGCINVYKKDEKTYTNIVVSSHYFCEKKKASDGSEEGGSW